MAGHKKRKRFLRVFLFITLFISIAFITLLAWLWFRSRELSFEKYPEFGIEIPSAYEIHGIDVSRYQQDISWSMVSDMQVRGIKIGFAFIKATEGIGNTDPYFKKNWRRTRNAGMVRGAYHFFLPAKSGRAQAENFIKRVALQSGDLPPVLDVETDQRVPSTRLRKEVKAWLDMVEEYYGVKPIIYTNVSFYEKYLEGHFEDYPLWVAHYFQPHKPRIRRDWIFWQHSEQGRVNGISSLVDFNVFYGDSTAFRSLLVP